jgi:hypothetical protein
MALGECFAETHAAHMLPKTFADHHLDASSSTSKRQRDRKQIRDIMKHRLLSGHAGKTLTDSCPALPLPQQQRALKVPRADEEGNSAISKPAGTQSAVVSVPASHAVQHAGNGGPDPQPFGSPGAHLLLSAHDETHDSAPKGDHACMHACKETPAPACV